MNRQVLRFGDCSIDIAARELRRAGVRVDLPPLVFDCIAYLIAHRARAVGRDELVAAVWGKAAISDTMLGKAILAARRAVGDTAEAQAFLRTVPRFGYHWVAATSIAEGTSADPARTSPEPARSGSRHRWIAIAIASIVVAVSTIAWIRMRAPAVDEVHRATSAATTAQTIAVLPAEVLAGASDSWLRLGLMDLFATRLREAGVTVMPSDSVVRVVSTTHGTDEAVAALASAGALRGWIAPAVRHTGEEWIVRAELIDASGRRQPVQASAVNPIAATEQAASRMLGLFGKTTPSDLATRGDIGLTELLQRTDAARLAENLDLARSLIAQAPAALQALPEVRERGVRIDLRAGQFERARTQIDALLVQVPVEADPVMHARLLENLCVARMRLGQLDVARAACDDAIRLLESRNEPLALGRAYNDRGILNAREGRRDAAVADFAHARVAITLAGDPLLLAQLDGNESTVEMVHGRPAEALPILLRAGDMFRRFGMINEFVTAVVNQIDANLMLLQPLDALKASDAAWPDRARITDPQIGNAFDEARAQALASNGRLGEARSLLDALIHRQDPRPDDAQIARAQSAEARIDLAAGQPATALVLAAQAVGALTAPDDAAERARAWLVQTRALRDVGRIEEAAHDSAAFVAWADAQRSATASDARVEVRAYLARAEQAAIDARDADALAAYRSAMDSAAAHGSADLVSEAVASYAGYLLAQGRLDEASVVAGKVARDAERDFTSALLQARLYHALGQQAAWQAALTRLRGLAGERPIPQALSRAPSALSRG